MLPPDCPLAQWLADRPRKRGQMSNNARSRALSARWVLTTPRQRYDTRWQRQPIPTIKRTKAVRKEAA